MTYTFKEVESIKTFYKTREQYFHLIYIASFVVAFLIGLSL